MFYIMPWDYKRLIKFDRQLSKIPTIREFVRLSLSYYFSLTLLLFYGNSLLFFLQMIKLFKLALLFVVIHNWGRITAAMAL